MRLACVLLLTVIGFCFTDRAHANGWREIALQAHHAQREGRPDDAKRLWLNALHEAEKLGRQHPWYSASLRNLGRVYFLSKTQKDYAQAEVYFQRELNVLDPLGIDYCDRVYDLYYLGHIKAIQGCFEESLRYYNEADRIGTKYYSPRPEVLLNYQVPLHALRRFKEERSRRQEFMKYFQVNGPTRRNLPDEIYRLVLSLLNDAFVAGQNSDPLDAVKHSEPFYAVAVNALSHAIDLLDSSTETRTLRHTLLELRATTRKKLHPEASNFETMCDSYCRSKQVGKATEVFERGVKELLYSCSKTGDAAAEKLSATLAGLAWRHHGLIHLDRSEELLQSALPAVCQSKGKDSIEVYYLLNVLAHSYFVEGKSPQAARELENLVAIARKRQGWNILSRNLTVLADTYWASSKFAQAEPIYKEELSVVLNANDDGRIAESCFRLARNYGSWQKFSQAEPLYKKSLEFYDKAGILPPQDYFNCAISFFRHLHKDAEVNQLEKRMRSVKN